MTEGSGEIDGGVGFWAEAARHPDKPAVIMVTGEVTTYRELADDVNRASSLLLGFGLAPGDHMAFLLGNQVETLRIALAATQIGVFYTPINRNLKAPEVTYILEDSESKLFIADQRFGEVAAEAAEGAHLPADVRLAFGEVAGFRSLSALAADRPTTLPAERVSGSAFYYTSGTTGRPKGVWRGGGPRRDLRATLAGYVQMAQENGLTSEGVHLVQGPLHHSGPLGQALNTLNIGATVVVMDKWNAEVCLELIERYRVTTTQMVPTMFQRLVALPDEVKAGYDVSSIGTGQVKHGSAACPVHVKRAMIDWWGPVLVEIYGGQEGRITSIDSQEWLTRPGSVGRVDKLTTVKIFDEDGRECGIGEVGTVYGKVGPVEYFKAPEKTAASRRGDLFTLGDMGYIDPEGWLFLVDRRVDLIVSGGVNIYPAEVEAVLLQHPAVLDVAVIGIPNEEWGHEVKAVVELVDYREASPALESELIEFSQQHLAKYKSPRTVDFRPELPRDALGKLRKFALRDEYLVGAEPGPGAG